ncbi:MAG: FG-GAP-like repeat-containing protein, partial [Calditrichia bacterium]
VLTDLNQDSAPDLVAVNYNQWSDGSIAVMINQGNGTFGNRMNYPVGLEAAQVLAADLNGDDVADLVVPASGSDTLYIYLNDGTGAFSLSGTHRILSEPSGAAVSDFDDDSDPDILVLGSGSSRMVILENNGNGVFSFAGAKQFAGNKIIPFNLNNDGLPDIAIYRSVNHIYFFTAHVDIYRNNGNFNFTKIQQFDLGSSIFEMIPTDFDDDQKEDLLVSGTLYSGPAWSLQVRYLRNTGNDSLESYNDFYSAAGRNMALGDFNNDLFDDLVVTSSTYGTDFFTVMLNDGNGAFQPPYYIRVGRHPAGIATGDVDNDGDLDVAVAIRDSASVAVLLNNSIISGIVEPAEIPLQYSLSQNYPNPFNASTRIQYHLKEKADVEIEIFNVLAQQIRTINLRQSAAGTHSINFDASRLPSGIYYYRFSAKQHGETVFREMKRMILLK